MRQLRPSLVRAFALLLPLAAPAAAQDDNSPARLWIDLENLLPRRAPSQDAAKQQAQQQQAPVDWRPVLESAAVLHGRTQGTPVEPFAMFYFANFQFQSGSIEDAQALFQGLKETFPDHPLCKAKVSAGGKSLVEEALADCASEMVWVKKYPRRQTPDPVLNEDLTATLNFTAGDVEIKFYDNVAPKHVTQFLNNVSSNRLDGTIIGRAVADMLVTIGVRETDSGRMTASDPTKGDPPAIPFEFSRLTHTRGMVTMIRNLGQNESHGTQFQVILKDQPYLDFQQTIFGKVTKGIEILEAVSRGPKNQFEQPATMVKLKGVKITDNRRK